MGLRVIRKSAGLSQATLAERVGVDQRTISRAENLSPSVTLSVFMRCADVLHVSLADIFREGERTAEEDALLRRWRSLQADRDKERFLRLLDLVLNDEPGLGSEGGKVADLTDT
jgi:transcriptional regulator with XRE-family HTH domain